MNYTIPKSRQEAIEIFNRLLDDYVTWLPETEVTKYHMFIGALCGCSDREFEDYTEFVTMIDCKLCNENSSDFDTCSGHCAENTQKIFSKRWNE